MAIFRILSATTLATICSSALAVMLASDGSGQVLIYPYYTVEDGTNTLISLENATSRGKAAKIRFLEALNGRPVLDFNLYLAPRDVWTGMITADTGGGAKLVVVDETCTVPAIAPGDGSGGEKAFVTFNFDGTVGGPADAEANRGPARTREGFVEVIEMGDIDPEYDLVNGTNFLAAITHIATESGLRRPKDCPALTAEWAQAAPFPTGGHGTAQATADVAGLYATTGGLAGTATLINVAEGTDFSYDPVALLGFYMDKPPMHTPPGSAAPSLADAAPVSIITVADPNTGIPAVKTDDWTNPAAGTLAGIDAVSAALMRLVVFNEFVVNTAIHAGTDWVITFPTKRWYVDQVANPVRPFSTLFTTGGACERFARKIYDQADQTPSGGISFPIPPINSDPKMCWASNVLTFNNSTVLGNYSDAVLNINVGSYRAGRMDLSFPASVENTSHPWANAQTPGAASDRPSHLLVNEAAPGHTYEGLPMIGFAVQRYVNDVLPGGVLSNYGGAYTHRFERRVVP